MKIINKIRKTAFAHIIAQFIRHRQIDYYNSKIIPELLKEKRKKESLRVAFIVYNISMWKYKSLYEAMDKDEKFHHFLVLTPSPGKNQNVREAHLLEMQKEFSSLNYEMYPKIIWNDLEFDSDFFADIVFLAQMYTPRYLTKVLKKYLFCYCPYGFPTTSSSKWAVDTFLHNIAWKEFQATQISIDESSTVMYNKAKNRICTGYIFGDELSKGTNDQNKKWKDTGKQLKRIIWAPHFSIDPNRFFHISTFLDIYNTIYKLAIKYKNEIQIAFKPHPFLYSKLCEERIWGKERTDEYYNKWKQLENGQLEQGEYVDLFCSSDAIIHDCGSFTVEYLYTKKPAMYLINNLDKRQADSLCLEALDCYYQGSTIQEIEYFIKNIVIDNKDILKEKRIEFYKKYLQQKNQQSVASNIINIIKKEIFIT